MIAQFETAQPWPVVFCLSSGRSGTHFLYEICQRNLRGVRCEHETYLFNPSMFGLPIYHRAIGDAAALERAVTHKRQAIERYSRYDGYVETSHAFLKSWADQAAKHFPQMKLAQLVREPLRVAKSEWLREQFVHRIHFPFRNYRAPNGKRYFRWALAGLEPIFQTLSDQPLTPLQGYVVQWIEIENRAMEFLTRHHKRGDCMTLHSPHDLNTLAKIESLLDFLGLPRRQTVLDLRGRKNRTPGQSTELTADDERQFDEVVSWLPAEKLEIFRHAPYNAWEWSRRLVQ